MRKISISVAVLAWVVTAIFFLKNNYQENKTIAGAFQTTDYSYMCAKIVGYGTYNVTMNAEAREQFIRSIASGLGIASPYSITETEDTLICEKISDNGKLVLEMIETDGISYLGVKLDLNDNINSAETYEQLVRDIFEAEGIEGNVNLYFEGHIKGALNYEERCRVADEMLEALDAHTVTESRDNSAFTIYAYTDRISRYVKSIGKKININITASYDENKNVTVIYLATPLNNLDY